jgi:hypothetical protein
MKAHRAPYAGDFYSRGYRAYVRGYDTWAQFAAARRVRTARTRVARRARKQETGT